MLGKVICEGCEGKLIASIEADTFSKMTAILPSLIISCHATIGHCNHSLKFSIEGADLKDYRIKPLKIKCINNKCAKGNISMETEVPIELVSALTIVFHSSHEGHRLQITFDGQTWESPE